MLSILCVPSLCPFNLLHRAHVGSFLPSELFWREILSVQHLEKMCVFLIFLGKPWFLQIRIVQLLHPKSICKWQQLSETLGLRSFCCFFFFLIKLGLLYKMTCMISCFGDFITLLCRQERDFFPFAVFFSLIF